MKRITFSKTAAVVTILTLAFSGFPAMQFAQAAVTGTLNPSGQGFYTAWVGTESEIDENGAPDCEDNNTDGDDNVSTATTGHRESVLIDLSGIPNGSTITSVDVNVTYRNGNNSGADDGTFQTFTRLNGTDLDSGADIVATNTTCTSGTQAIDVVDTVKGNSTTLEVGVVKTATDTSEVWVGTVRAIVTYEPVPNYSISGSYSFSGPTLNLTGIAAGDPDKGANDTQHLAIDWDEDKDGNPGTGLGWRVAPAGGVTFTPTFSDGSNNSPSFTSTWSGTHDYTSTGGGAYTVRAMVYHGNTPGQDGSAQSTLTFNVVVPEPNPTLANSCGLDIALVMDSSGSISTSELSTMKTAFNSFVSAFLPATPTLFSVVDFDTNATVLQTLTSNTTDLAAAINTPGSGGNTNWEQAIQDAQASLVTNPPGRVGSQNLIIFASDGNPTYANDPGTNVDDVIALNEAVTAANVAKTAGTRIITLGIGSGVNQANLEAISSSAASGGYYSVANFGDLSSTLQNIATTLCGGSVTVNKVIDEDGNTGTTGDQTSGTGWTFIGTLASGLWDNSPDYTGDGTMVATGNTNGSGLITFKTTGGTHNANIVESVMSGYNFVSASCNLGSGSIAYTPGSNFSLTPNSIVSCIFYNTPNQPPVITVTGDNPLELVVNVDSYVEQGATASDAEDGPDTFPPGNGNWTVDSSGVNTAIVGPYTVYYDFIDSDGAAAVQKTRTVNVVVGDNECNDGIDNDGDDDIDFGSDAGCTSVDGTSENEAPVITVVPEIVQLALNASAPTVTDGVTANDPEEGDITGSIVVGGETVDTSVIDDYTVTYNVQDSLIPPEGAAQKTRVYKVRAQCDDGIDNDDDGDFDYDVEVGDSGCSDTSDNDENTPPVITLTLGSSPYDSATVNLLTTDIYTELGATADDAEDSPEPTVVVGGDAVTNTSGTYVVTYNATDSDGATAAEVVRTIIVSTAPQCSDGEDNDEAQGTDASDPDCHTDGNAQNQSTYNPNINNESGPITQCNDGLDNDNNEDTDAQDPQCHTDGDTENLDSYDDTIDNESIPVDICSNIEGLQESVPSGMTASNGICTAILTPPTPPSNPPGGNGPPISLSFGGGSVLGASTGQVLGESCGLYLNKHIRRGSPKNDAEQVKKLQEFLNKWMGSGLPVTGFYGPLSEAAVKAFQAKYSGEILKPWNLSTPTGLVYLSTLRQVNKLECPELSLELPPLVPWSQNPNAQ